MRRECRERFPRHPRISDPDMHHGTCVTHVPGCMPGSLTSGFLWSRWRGKRSRHSWRMRNPQFYVSGKRPMTAHSTVYGTNWERATMYRGNKKFGDSTRIDNWISLLFMNVSSYIKCFNTNAALVNVRSETIPGRKIWPRHKTLCLKKKVYICNHKSNKHSIKHTSRNFCCTWILHDWPYSAGWGITFT